MYSKEDIFDNVSEELDSLLSFINNEMADELPILTIGTDYFVLASIMHKKNNMFRRISQSITSSGIDALYSTFYQVVSSKALTAVKNNRKPIFSDDMEKIFNRAKEEAKELGNEYITSDHIFLAILYDTSDENKIRKVFNKASITYGTLKAKISSNSDNDLYGDVTEEITKDGKKIKVINFSSKEDADEFINQMINGNDMSNEERDIPIPENKKKKGKNANINEYCENLNELAEKGKIEPIIGRERELNELIRILGRKKKNNAILLGGEGIGKTAIGESLAYKIVNGDVPEFLSNKVVISLDMTAAMAGTTLRGMFEERIKGILEEIKADKNFILFMDNIGAIMADRGRNDFEISAMLARSLENGEVQVIGTSDFASYRKTFDKDPSLARRFQKILVEAPSIEESIKILYGVQKSYEEYHHVKYTDDAIISCVNLANRYITERNLPDSAIDVLDEAGALIGTIQNMESLKNLRLKIKEKNNLINELKNKGEFSEADKISQEIKSLKKEYNDSKESYEKELIENPKEVGKNVILDVIATKTGIPVNNLTSDDKKLLVGINDRLKKHVIGQNEAIDTICKALKRNRIGLHKHGCMYSSMMIGKTGTGKTLIAKQLAKELFGDENSLVRFDMSEFSDKVAVNKLIGSNPGYVGYEEGGQLTEAIKNKKHCVLLLDEIEKADPEIYNIFLQVLDEGFLTDNSGMKVDFKNVIVIFTSNVGAKAASDFGKGIGFNENEEENTKRILLKQLKNRFPPEFINRIDDVIYFNALTDENMKDIIRIEINKMVDNVKSIGFNAEYDDDTVDFIFNAIKEEKEYGARPIIRAIQDNIENAITDKLLENDFCEGYNFKISCLNGKIIIF